MPPSDPSNHPGVQIHESAYIDEPCAIGPGTKGTTERLTILIPTMNRPRFLSRVLSYYRGLKCTIIVADSSDMRHPSIKKDHPRVHYLFYEGASFQQKILEATSCITTPYFLICGDDDFVLIDAIKRGLDFLEKNPQFAAVQGQQGNFYFEPGAFRKVVFSVRYPLQYLEQIVLSPLPILRATDRMKRIFSRNYLPWVYSIQRRETLAPLRELYERFDENIYFDWLSAYSVALTGSFAVLPILYALRYDFKKTPRRKIFHKMDSGEESDRREILAFYECLASRLAAEEGLPLSAALEVIESGFRDVRAVMVEKEKKKGLIRCGLGGRVKCDLHSCVGAKCRNFPDVAGHPVEAENYTLLSVDDSFTCLAKFHEVFPLFSGEYESVLTRLSELIMRFPP